MSGEAGAHGRRLALLALLVAGAAALRLHRLTFQSLWFDELFSVVFSHPDRSVGEIVATYATDFHPLLYPLLLHGWMALFGATEGAARLASALAGIAGVPVMVALGPRAGGELAGWFAGLLTAVNAFHLAYSQEVRSYAFLFLLAAGSTLAGLRLAALPGRGTALVWAVAAGATLHTHYYGLILAGAQLAATAAVLLQRAPRRRALAALATAAGALLALALPWAGPLARAAGTTEYWPARPGPFFAADYFHLYFGRVGLLTATFALLLAALPLLLRRLPPSAPTPDRLPPRSAAAMLAGVVALSLLAPYLWSLLVVPMLIPRATLVVLPALLALLAVALAALPGRALRAAVVAAVALASVLPLFARDGYFATVAKEQWREAARWAAGHPARRPGDTFVSELAPGFQFYFDQDGVGARVEPATLAAVAAAAEARGTLWLLVARDRRGDEAFRTALATRFTRAEERPFFAAAGERWDPRP